MASMRGSLWSLSAWSIENDMPLIMLPPTLAEASSVFPGVSSLKTLMVIAFDA